VPIQIPDITARVRAMTFNTFYWVLRFAGRKPTDIKQKVQNLVPIRISDSNPAGLVGWLVEQGITSHSSHCIGYFGENILQVWWPNQQRQSTEAQQGGWAVEPLRTANNNNELFCTENPWDIL